MHDLIRDKFNLQDLIKTDNLSYKSKIRKVYNFSEKFFSNVFSEIIMKDIYQ